MRRPLLISCLLFLCIAQGCAWGIYEDKRLMDTMSSDKTLAASIKTALIKDNFSNALAVAVYCYYGNVFLIGEIPANMQGKALAIARSFKPRSVTPHWFSPARGDRGNFVLATDLRSALIGTKGLSSTRIDTEVNAGRVVLLGVVHDEAEKKLAINTARKVKGVVSVTSFLMLPQKPYSHEQNGSAEE